MANEGIETSKVSIVMPLYNAEKYVKEAIQSVICQSHQNWELFVIDDCSTDNSYAIVKGIATNDPRIHLLQNDKNSGTAKTRNEGLKRANGEYIAFLDSDDYWDPNFLEEQLKFIKEKGYTVVTAGYRRKTDKTCTDFIPPTTISADSILGGNPISCLSTLFKRDENNQILFDESLVKAEDLLFWYETLKKNGQAAGNKLVLATYRIVENSKSRKKFKLIKWQWAVYKKIGLGFWKSFRCLIKWSINGLKKYHGVR